MKPYNTGEVDVFIGVLLCVCGLKKLCLGLENVVETRKDWNNPSNRMLQVLTNIDITRAHKINETRNTVSSGNDGSGKIISIESSSHEVGTTKCCGWTI